MSLSLRGAKRRGNPAPEEQHSLPERRSKFLGMDAPGDRFVASERTAAPHAGDCRVASIPAMTAQGRRA